MESNKYQASRAQPERVALSDEEIEQYATDVAGTCENIYHRRVWEFGSITLCQFARAILAAQSYAANPTCCNGSKQECADGCMVDLDVLNSLVASAQNPIMGNSTCACGKQTIGWCMCNYCHKQPGYNYDKTMRALNLAAEFKGGSMHFSAAKFWEIYGIPITQPVIAEATQDDTDLLAALETGLECATQVANDTHEQFRGYKPGRHAAVDADVDRIKKAIANVNFGGSAISSYIRFAGLVLAAHRNDGYSADIYGEELERMALECGMIEERIVTEQCGETCACAGYIDSFPGQCMFATDAGKAAIAASKEQK